MIRVSWAREAADRVRAVALPRRSDYAGFSWRRDLLAGLTVGVVALPLALGFGVASGLGAAAGLVTAVVAGLVAALFGGSRFQVSGPTGAMTVVLVPIVAQRGTGAVAMVGLLAGLLVIAIGLAGLGRAVAYIPWPVVEGFTLGIAVIIFVQQIPLALGVPPASGTNTTWVAVRTLAATDYAHALPSLAIVALVMAIMVVTPRISRSLPGALIAVAVAAIVATLTDLPVTLIGPLPDSLPPLSFPDLDLPNLSGLVGPALAVAALAAIESLLSARVADSMAGQPPRGRVDPDRELFGQGLASVASSLFGGMPATGAIARTAVNVRAGARTRVAAVVHALVLLGVVLLAGPLVAHIPTAALAGVLMMTSIRMVESRAVRAVTKAGRSDAAIFVLTAGCTVLFDLIVAVEVGVAVAALMALRAMARSSRMRQTELLRANDIEVYTVDGSLFFGTARDMFDAVQPADKVSVVVLRLRDVHVLDASGAQLVKALVDDLRSRGITVLLKGVQHRHRKALGAVGVLRDVDDCTLPVHRDRHEFDEMDAALEHAGRHAAARAARA